MIRQAPIDDRTERYRAALLSGQPLRPSGTEWALGDLVALCAAAVETMQAITEQAGPPESSLRDLLGD